jgi:hypothetical protein
VDLQLGVPRREPEPDAMAGNVEPPIIIPDSGSETEVEDEVDAAPLDPPRLPTTWAFSQNRIRVEGQVGPRIRMEGHILHRVTTAAVRRQRRAR